MLDLKRYIRTVPDFPKKGVFFRDISPLLLCPEAFGQAVREHASSWAQCRFNNLLVAGIEARGFVFGVALARELNAGFILIRKAGKLPGEVFREEYGLEYGKDALEIQRNAISYGNQPVLLVDDVLATGGTAVAACKLLRNTGARVIACIFTIELDGLGGRQCLREADPEILVHSLMTYKEGE